MTLLKAKEFNKIWLNDGVKYRLKVIAGLQQFEQQKPYFSVTGDHEYQAKNNRWCLISTGAVHYFIAKQIPELKPLLLVHLADENGVPMHAYQNAAYWAGQTKFHKLDLVNLAHHLRVDQAIVIVMIDYITNYLGELDAITTPAMAWQNACEHFGLLKLWQKQADAAQKMLNQVSKLEEVTK